MSGHIEYHPHAGAEIGKVCADAQRIADLLGVTIKFRFNDVLCMAVVGGDAALLAERQQAEQRREKRGAWDHGLASSRPAAETRAVAV